MDQKAPSKTRIFKKWSLLRISIIVLGNLVIFGLGFALGLHYAQNLYFVKKKVVSDKDFTNERNDSIVKTQDEFSFFYGLKNPDKVDIKRYDEVKVLRKKKEKIENQKFKENLDLRGNNLLHVPYGYTIQLYSFKSKDVSKKKVLELREKGYSAYQSKIDLGNNDIYYRVRVGQFENREDAAKVLDKIFESETKEAYITRN